jgi:hypothetical protein
MNMCDVKCELIKGVCNVYGYACDLYIDVQGNSRPLNRTIFGGRPSKIS